MKILMVASEAVPFIKTGGLGDVAGTLALELHRAGHEVALVLPRHYIIDPQGLKEKFSPFFVNMGNTTMFARVMETDIEGMPVYLIDYEDYFGRHPIYDDGEEGYPDNAARFAFFSKAALDLAVALDFKPDVVHCSDWQTALVPYYVKAWGWPGDFFKGTASVLTIHNIGYQGIHSDLSLARFIGLNWMQLRPDEFESFGGVNLLKGGFFYADQITTVSPTYAQEILTEPGGNGLSPYLLRRKEDVSGILNGIDTDEWNPAKDRHLPAKFSAKDLKGKAACKAELQKAMGLEVNPDKPVFGLVGRLAEQKGLDLLQKSIHEILGWDLQIALLGSGMPELEGFFGWLPGLYPGKMGSYIGFQNRLAHLIEAGSDFFIMPSRYEPCGLNQMYSMAYGTLPIVRATGGLVDTVQNYDPKAGTGTGFVFEDIDAGALRDTIGWALYTWYNDKKGYLGMQQRAMKKDFSWKQAVKGYETVYKKALGRRAGW
ncbi:MAG: glycogen synthase GlgA [bacterium]|nr:glycogen synthase GlgA [bacterium]